MLDVEQWAEIRRMKRVEGLSQREIHRRTGVHRDTIRRALASPEPPSYGPRPRRASKLDPYRAEVERLLAGDPTLSGVRVREEIEALGYEGSKTILDELLFWREGVIGSRTARYAAGRRDQGGPLFNRQNWPTFRPALTKGPPSRRS